jgi:hypothetical protein
MHYTIICTHVAHEDLPRTGCISNLGAVSRYQAGLDKLRAIIQGNLGFIFATMLGQESDPVTKARNNEVKLGVTSHAGHSGIAWVNGWALGYHILFK